MRIAPGVTVNLSKSGASVSVGPRGAKMTVGPRGTRQTVGIPGTGLFYTKTEGRTKKKPIRSKKRIPAAHSAPDSEPSPEFFERLLAPEEHKPLIDGIAELSEGEESKALSELRKVVHLADGAFLSGCLCLKHGQHLQAIRYLNAAIESRGRLGKLIDQYGLDAAWDLPVSDTVVAKIQPNLRGALLALVEAYQREGCWQDAVDCLKRLRRLEPDDIVIKLSFAELLMTFPTGSAKIYRKVVELADGITNESAIHAALLYYKGIALRRLGVPAGSRDVLTAAIRRRKDRPIELLRAIRYERALVYEDLGQTSRVREDLERIYAEQSDYEDVEERLGVSG